VLTDRVRSLLNLDPSDYEIHVHSYGDNAILGPLEPDNAAPRDGPFWITIDVFFATDADYAQAAAPGVLTTDTFLYRLPNIRVIKTSFPRPVVQGAFADRDMHSGQQHIPLAQLPIGPTSTEV
jgi:hypothetical protein